jgi:hypothetical protein
MCGNKSWTVAGYAVLPIVENFNVQQIGGPGLPLVPVVCNVCGNTVLVNARIAGLLGAFVSGQSAGVDR